MNNNNVSLTIVINGANREHIAREFVSPIDRQTYVEGREGSNFTLRLRNSNPFRVIAIPSVDGLSVLDGKPAGDKSSGYILEAHGTLDIPGWTVDQGTVAKFFFSGMKADGSDDSYAVQSGNDPANKGVIGLKVFREKISHNAYFASSNTISSNMRGGYDQRTKGMFPHGISTSMAPLGGSVSNGPFFGSTSSVTMNNISASASMTQSFGDSHEDTSVVQDQVLGTGFGAATDFATTKVEFQRGDLLAMMVIYYDEKRGLKRRGIDVDRPVPSRPSAFPADITGCIPPKNWKP